MKLLLQTLGEDNMPTDQEIPLDRFLFVKIELESGHELKLREERGGLYIHSSNGQLEIGPRATNAILLKVASW